MTVRLAKHWSRLTSLATGRQESSECERVQAKYVATFDPAAGEAPLDVDEGLQNLLERIQKHESADLANPADSQVALPQDRLLAVLRFELGDQVVASWVSRVESEDELGIEGLLETFLGRSAATVMIESIVAKSD